MKAKLHPINPQKVVVQGNGKARIGKIMPYFFNNVLTIFEVFTYFSQLNESRLFSVPGNCFLASIGD